MRNTLSSCNFDFSGTNVTQEFNLLQEFFIALHVEENSRTPSMLGQDHGSFGIPHVPDNLRNVGTKLGKRSNVFSKPDFRHDILDLMRTVFSTVDCT
jgi:hypothetical protein